MSADVTESRLSLNLLLQLLKTTNKPNNKSPASLLSFINHFLLSLHPGSTFLPFLVSPVPYPPISFLLFCVIKFEQRKVDCLSVLQNKSIIPLSHGRTADDARRLVKGRLETEKLRGTFLNMSQLIVIQYIIWFIKL